MSISRKLVIHLLLVLMLLVGASLVAAAPGAATTHETVRETVTWTLPAGQCPSLPSGISVSGTGERLAVTNTKVNADGSTQIVINDLVKGTAVDSDGGTYKFLYQNHSTQRVPPSGSPIQIEMKDSFVLNGSASHLSVGFLWRWTFNSPAELWPPVDNWQQVSTRGEPFLCDPI